MNVQVTRKHEPIETLQIDDKFAQQVLSILRFFQISKDPELAIKEALSHKS